MNVLAAATPTLEDGACPWAPIAHRIRARVDAGELKPDDQVLIADEARSWNVPRKTAALGCGRRPGKGACACTPVTATSSWAGARTAFTTTTATPMRHPAGRQTRPRASRQQAPSAPRRPAPRGVPDAIKPTGRRPAPGNPPVPEMNRAAMTVPVRRPLAGQDTVILGLLRLAAEVILTHPSAVPPDLYEMCDSWADELAAALSPPARTEQADAAAAPAASRQPATTSTARTAVPASSPAGSGT